MSCSSPLRAFPVGVYNNGKIKYKVCSSDIDYVYSLTNDHEHWYAGHGKFTPNSRYDHITDYIDIPCGHCMACRLARSREWANRCMLEASYYENNHFLTLTYDDEHLPECNTYVDKFTGAFEVSPVHPLVKRDLQLFMKRLRKHYSDQRIRFYACGEYGTQSMRPHYHLILFNFKCDDKQFLKRSSIGDLYYTSESIAKLWPFGFHILTEVNWDTCAYVARYCTKKLYGNDAHIYDDLNYTPEFSLMSRKPGIARQYYDDNVEEIYKFDKIVLSSFDGCNVIRPPKYYDRLYDIDYPSDSILLKMHRNNNSDVVKQLKSEKTSLDYYKMLKSEEKNLEARVKSLKRNSI